MRGIKGVILWSVVTLVIEGQSINMPNIPLQVAFKPIIIIEKDTVRFEEFLFYYLKTHQNEKVDKQSMEEYLDTYLKFKLKVLDAKMGGIDTTSSYKREIEMYKNQLINSFLEDREYREYLIREMFEFMKWENCLSHILIRVNDSVNAKRQIEEIYRRLQSGESFEELAKRYSQDVYSREKGGYLGWYAGNFFTYDIEKEINYLKKGENTKPILTEFGWHIFKLNDRRPFRGKIRVAHILIKVEPNAPFEKIQDAKKRAMDIMDSIRQGKSFAEMAKKYSEDKATAFKGGVLDYFYTGLMEEAFTDSAFAIRENGGISGPVQTSLGFHIIQRIDLKQLGQYEDHRGELMGMFMRDKIRFNLVKERFISRLRQEYSVHVNERLYKHIKDRIDTSIIALRQFDKISTKKFSVDDVLLTLKDSITGKEKSYSGRDILEKIFPALQGLKEITQISAKMDSDFRGIIDSYLIDFEKELLPIKNKQFGYLLKEYTEGALVFNILEKKVWNIALSDTQALYEYWLKNKEKYKWDERADATIYFIDSLPCLKRFEKMHQKGINKGWSSGEILDALGKKEKCYGTKVEGLYLRKENPYIDSAKWEPGFYGPFFVKGSPNRFAYVYISKIVPPTPRDFLHARGMAIADFQEYLRENWEKELMRKYKYYIFPELINEYLTISKGQ